MASHTNGADPAAKTAGIAAVFRAIQGHWLSSSLAVLLELNIAEILTGEGKPLPLERVAELAGVAKEGVDPLYKVLRVSAQYDLLEEHPGKVFEANLATKQMVRGDFVKFTPTLGDLAHHLVNKPKWDAFKMLPDGVKSGKTPFTLAHGGLDVFEYGELPEHADFGQEFCRAMTWFTQHCLEGPNTPLSDAYPWKNSKVLMDVGGGHGELLSRCMAFAGDGCKGMLFDRPMVIDSIDIPGTFEAKGIKNAKDRLTFVVGEVREPFPDTATKANVDTLLMKHFLSGFSDDDAKIVINNCKNCLSPDGRILLLQTLVPEAGDKKHNECADGVAPGLFAIEIFTQCPGGFWRTMSEWVSLFKTQGMKLEKSVATGHNMHLLVWANE